MGGEAVISFWVCKSFSYTISPRMPWQTREVLRICLPGVARRPWSWGPKNKRRWKDEQMRRKQKMRGRSRHSGQSLGLIPHESQCSQAMLLGSQGSVSPDVKLYSVSYKPGNIFTFLLNHRKLRFDLSEAFDIGSAN
jgi:hypothetical protein